MRPPKLVKPYVKSFGRQVLNGREPDFTYVANQPLDVSFNDCFVYVKEHAQAHGGEMLIGWAIWERPKLFIEAEFHAVWKTNDGELIDLNPRPIPIPRVLFLPDTNRRYEGRQVDNIRKPLCRDANLIRFLSNQSQWFGLLNEGDLADYHGEIVMTPAMKKLQKEQLTIEMYLERKYGRWLPESS